LWIGRAPVTHSARQALTAVAGAAKRSTPAAISALLRAAGNADDVRGEGAMTVTNGLYTIQIEMTDGGQGRAHGVIVLHDGKVAGGDSYFYYTGSYTADRGKWRGELITNEHTKSAGARPLFGGREVTCGFSGSYTADGAQVQGTALVGKTSVLFHARLKLCSPF
jgi:hypothetical protein